MGSAAQNQPITLSGSIGLVLSTGVALVAHYFPTRIDDVAQVLIITFGNAVIWLGVIAYSTRRSTPVANPVLPSGTSVKVQGTEDSVVIAPTPPGPTGIEGDGTPQPVDGATG